MRIKSGKKINLGEDQEHAVIRTILVTKMPDIHTYTDKNGHVGLAVEKVGVTSFFIITVAASRSIRASGLGANNQKSPRRSVRMWSASFEF